MAVRDRVTAVLLSNRVSTTNHVCNSAYKSDLATDRDKRRTPRSVNIFTRRPITKGKNLDVGIHQCAPLLDKQDELLIQQLLINRVGGLSDAHLRSSFFQPQARRL